MTFGYRPSLRPADTWHGVAIPMLPPQPRDPLLAFAPTIETHSPHRWHVHTMTLGVQMPTMLIVYVCPSCEIWIPAEGSGIG